MISVILLEKISKLGNIGQEVKVKDGFARNYLIPNKKAIRASEENKKIFELKKEELVKINDEKALPSLPLPISKQFLSQKIIKSFPKLGEQNKTYMK